MQQFARDRAVILARTMRQTVEEARWVPDIDASSALAGLERALSISIQEGQPSLEEMQSQIVSTYASELLDHARSAYASHRICAPTYGEERLLGSDRTRTVDFIDVRQPVGEVVDVSHFRRRHAIAA